MSDRIPEPRFQKRKKKKQIDYVFCRGGGPVCCGCVLGIVGGGCGRGPGGSVGGSPVGSGKLKKKKY